MAANDKVMFKVGLQAAIDKMINDKTGYSIGTFYLTSDSDRLYVGQATGLQLLNKSVKVVPNEAGLPTSPHKDDFAYLSQENVLAVYDGKKWIQINPDTNTIITAITKQVKEATGGGATITTTVSTKTGDNTDSIKGTDITIIGDAGAKVEQNGTDGIKVTGDTYTLNSTIPASDSVDIKLTSALGQKESSINVTAGNNVQITGAEGKITVSATDTKLESVNAACSTNGELTIQVKDTSGGIGKKDTVTLGYKINDIFYGVNHEGNLPIYTKEQVDKLFTDLNPMKYVGTIGSSGTYNISPTDFNKVLEGTTPFNISSGDMFLVSGEVIYATGKTAKTGDVLIASGTEEKGIITGNITWNYVPSGDDTILDTESKVKANASDNSLTIFNKTGTDDKEAGQIKITQGTAITMSSKVEDSDPTNKITDNRLNVTINHADIECAKPVAESIPLSKDNRTFNAVKNLEVSPQGHVTKIETEKITAAIYNPGPDVITNETAGVKVAHSIYENGQAIYDNTSFFTVASDSLSIKKDTNSATKFTVDLLWGSF